MFTKVFFVVVVIFFILYVSMVNKNSKPTYYPVLKPDIAENNFDNTVSSLTEKDKMF